MGYVPCKNESPEELLSSKFEIDVSGTICAAKASLKPLYDPLSERTKA